MQRAIRREVTVQPGGLIEIRAPELPAGTFAEIIVLLEEPQQRGHLASLIGTARGGFSSPEEVDRFLKEERDQWD